MQNWIHKIVFAAVVLLTMMPVSAKKRPVVPDSLQRLEFEIQGVPLVMQRVEGGSFLMGATVEQTDRDIYTNKPAHLVLLSPYYIATTEVTNALWRAVMPDKETISPKGYPTNPVAYVNWNDCQEFVRRLDSITGLPFCLPTEAQWEFAARGGAKSKSYRFAGDMCADSVGWVYPASGNWTHPVARKRPNELGLYDMTGNVSEWCQDRYGAYQLNTEPDPCGADTGVYRVARGGSYDDCVANSHLSVRRWYKPETSAGYVGFRVALRLPNDPAIQPQPEELPLTKSIHMKGQRLKFIYVPTEENPYYISEEVSRTLWKKIMDAEPEGTVRHAATGMSKEKRALFSEYCSRLTETALSVATQAETDTALHRGLITMEQPRRKKDNGEEIRKTQQNRRTRKRATVFTELFGVQLKQVDDPVLLEFRREQAENKTLRLVIHVR